jgi:DNA polymerase-1
MCRSCTKILSTFIDGLKHFIVEASVPYFCKETELNTSRIAMCHPHSRIHASWNQTIVRTGRLSCSKPNLQTIPNEKTINNIIYNVRDIFEATPGGWKLVSIDYSQIEMRILAHICQDEAMINIFRNAKDIYLILASMLFDKSVNNIKSIERDRAKVICLGKLTNCNSCSSVILSLLC